MKFDVHRSKYPSSELGVWLAEIEAWSHREAQEKAAEQFRGMAVVVVHQLKPRPHAVTKRDFSRGGKR